MANDEEPVGKALMASSSVAVTSEDSANSNLTTLVAPAESLPGELREPLSGGASTPLSGGASTPLPGGAPTPLSGGTSTPLSGRASTPLSGRASVPSGGRVNDEEPVEKALMASSSVAVKSEDSANSNLVILMAPAECLPGEVREPLPGGVSTPLSGGAPTPSGVRASLETARPSSALVPVTARTGAARRNNRIHRSNVVTRRAAAELTGAVTRYRGVCPNKNNNDDDNNINNNNHAALAECLQPSTLHKLQQLRLSTNTDTPDDNNITPTTTRLWRNVSSRIRCTSCDSQVSTPTRTRRIPTTSTTTTTQPWRNVFSRVRCTRCDI